MTTISHSSKFKSVEAIVNFSGLMPAHDIWSIMHAMCNSVIKAPDVVHITTSFVGRISKGHLWL